MSQTYEIPEKVWGVLYTNHLGPVEYEFAAGRHTARDERETVALDHLVERGLATPAAAPAKKKEA